MSGIGHAGAMPERGQLEGEDEHELELAGGQEGLVELAAGLLEVAVPPVTAKVRPTPWPISWPRPAMMKLASQRKPRRTVSMQRA
jgi:hypothetical protein